MTYVLSVATKNGGTPCGACRQVIWELCGDIPIPKEPHIPNYMRNSSMKKHGCEDSYN